jgi:hypothetical protein
MHSSAYPGHTVVGCGRRAGERGCARNVRPGPHWRRQQGYRAGGDQHQRAHARAGDRIVS